MLLSTLIAVLVTAPLPTSFNLLSPVQAVLTVRKADGTEVPLESTRPSAGILVVDGVSTGFHWDGTPLRVMGLLDGRLVIVGTYSRRVLLLWNVRRWRLSDLGAADLLRVGSSCVIRQGGDRLTISDIDPSADVLRPLWVGPMASRLLSISKSDDGLRMLVFDGLEHAVVTLRPWRRPTVVRSVWLQALLAARYFPPLDGFRGERLLLGRSPRLRKLDLMHVVSGEALIFDVATSQMRDLGLFPGKFTNHHAVPELVFHLEWQTVRASPFDDSITFVTEGSEEFVVRRRSLERKTSR